MNKTSILSMKYKNLIKKIILYILGYGVGFLFVLPFLWMFLTSIKTLPETFSLPITWLPSKVVWKNYILAWTNYAPFNRFLFNSLKITTLAVVGSVVSNVLIAYSFARLRWPGRDFMFIILLSTLMLPYHVTIIPIFVMFSKMGWVNTHLPLIIPYFFGHPFFVFLLRQFLLTIPPELDDAARIDGCGSFKILWKILVPLCKPGLATVGIFTFMWTWNDFLRPLIFLNHEKLYTLALGLMSFQTQNEVYWNHLMAASVLVMLPCILIFFFAQRYFIQGITMTGMKG